MSRAVLATVLALALWGVAPVLLGWHPTTVMTGSMMPRLHIGDVAVSRPLHGKAPTLGTVLLFEDPDHAGRLRLHRFVEVNPSGQLITRGDANAENDSSPVDLSAIRGVGTLRIPYLGSPVVWFRTGQWVKLAVTAAVFLALIVMANSSGARPKPSPDDHDTSGGPDGMDDSASRRAPAHDVWTGSSGGVEAEVPRGRVERRRTAGAAAAVLVGVVTGTLLTQTLTPAGAVFTSTTTASSSVTALPYFTCSAAVAGSAPYLYYRMDETTSTGTSATDSSGNTRTGTYSSTGRTSRATKACARDTGSAMTYDGSAGYLSSPLYNTAAPNTFTLSIWFKTNTLKGGKLIGFGNSQTGASGIYDRHLYLTNAGAVIFGVYPGGVRTISSADGFNDNKWHQAVATLSTAGQFLYVDGAQVAADTSTTSGESTGSGYWRIGYDNLDGWTNTPTSRFFAGTLDDAAVYLTAANATTVRNLYLAGT